MKALFLVAALALSDCASGASDLVFAPPAASAIVLAPELAESALLAVDEWNAEGAELVPVVGGEGAFRVMVGTCAPHLAITEGTTITVDLAFAKELGWVDADGLRRVVLHELGHALGVRFGGSDPWHYYGDEPSVMTTELTTTAAHLGAPELEIWRAR